MIKFYSIITVLGFILPYAFFTSWLIANDFNLMLIASEVMNSKLSMFAWADVLVSAIVLITFIQVEGRRQRIDKLWVPIVGTCTVGVSFGLPLFLLMREMSRSKPE